MVSSGLKPWLGSLCFVLGKVMLSVLLHPGAQYVVEMGTGNLNAGV